MVGFLRQLLSTQFQASPDLSYDNVVCRRFGEGERGRFKNAVTLVPCCLDPVIKKARYVDARQKKSLILAQSCYLQ